jgi:histidine triad (HIT) family protein
VFCRIINGRGPAYVIDEDERTIVFLSLENHPLVVPKAHLPDIFALDDATAAAVMRRAVAIAKAVRAGLRCDGVYLTQANGAAAGQDVFHFHLHVYPRWHGDTPRAVAPVANPDHQTKRHTRERLRRALRDAQVGDREGG